MRGPRSSVVSRSASTQALIATGGGIRRLQVEGGMRDGIHYIRALGNADKLRNELGDAERIVIVGGSYIATEVAASMVLLGKQVTLVMQEALPLERHFGPTAGAFARDLLGVARHRDRRLRRRRRVRRRGYRRRPCRGGRCADGRRVDADLVVVGVGANPDVMLARKAKLELGETGGVICDRTLRTSAAGVFAAGDMCEFDSVVHGRRLRIEHEEVAAAQGRHAARAMLGSDDPYSEIPYFWSDLADWATLEYVGGAASWDEEIVCGDPANGEFSVFYIDAGKVVGALAVGRAEDLDAARAFIADGAARTVRALT